MSDRWPRFRCACEFAKTLDERDPCNFPRVGLADNVLLRGRFIIRHTPTGKEAVITGHPPYTFAEIPAEAAECCFDWFNEVDQSSPTKD